MKLPFTKPAKKTISGRQRASQAGYQAPPTFSYYARRSEKDYRTGRGQKTPEENRAVRDGLVKFWSQRLGFLVGTLALLACAFNILTLSPRPRIVTLSSAASQPFLHTSEEYERVAAELLAESVWNRNKVTVNTAGVSKDLQRVFPELSSVSVTLPLLGHRPVVYVEPSRAALVLNSSNGAYVVDENGKALLSTSQLPASSRLDLPVVTDQSGLQIKPGQTALPSSQVRFIDEVVAQLKAKRVDISRLVLAGHGLDVYPSGKPYYVKFNLHGTNARVQAGSFLALQTYLNARKITPTQYIDVRIEGRAYYQ